ncbi:resistance protein, partial [Trifolium medium]|nr:resistance protein [Trifolium medium]
SLLDKGSDDGVHIVGIYGTGGLVRENSANNDLKHLQEELLLKTIGLEIKLADVSEGIPIIKERLCRKKILLILDDVDNMKQLQALAGGVDCRRAIWNRSS